MRSVPLRTARLALVATIAVAMSMAVPTPADADEPHRLDFSDARLWGDGGYIYSADFSGDDSDDIWITRPGPANDLRWNGTTEDAFDDWGREAFDLRGDYDVTLVGDFDGDGDDDMWIIKPGRRNDRMLMADGANSFDNLGSDSFDVSGVYDRYLVGDFDGDGSDDVWFHNAGRDNDRMLTANAIDDFTNHGRNSFDIAGSYDFYAPGDYDGDGDDDVWLYKVGRGNDRMLTSMGVNDFHSHGRNSFDVAGYYYDITTGDFSGDGRTDLVLNESTGQDRRFNGAGPNMMTAYGKASFSFYFYFNFTIPGDWNGDGMDDLYAVADNGDHRVLTSGGNNTWVDHTGVPPLGMSSPGSGPLSGRG